MLPDKILAPMPTGQPILLLPAPRITGRQEPVVQTERAWHVLLVRPRTEKKVAAQLTRLGIPAYVPVQRQVRIWCDRKKKVDMVMFHRYVFVEVDEDRRKEVFRLPNVYRYLTFGRDPVCLCEREVQLIRILAGLEKPVLLVREAFHPGDRVEIMSGPLAGYQGQVTDRHNRSRIILTLEGLQCRVLVELDKVSLKKLKAPMGV